MLLLLLSTMHASFYRSIISASSSANIYRFDTPRPGPLSFRSLSRLLIWPSRCGSLDRCKLAGWVGKLLFRRRLVRFRGTPLRQSYWVMHATWWRRNVAVIGWKMWQYDNQRIGLHCTVMLQALLSVFRQTDFRHISDIKLYIHRAFA